MMDGSRGKLALLAGALMLAGFLGAVIGTTLVHPSNDEPYDVRGFLESSVSLTDDQRRRLDDLEAHYDLAMREYETRLQASNDRLARVFVEQKTLTPEVEDAVETIHDTMGALQKVTLRYLYEVRGVLDEEQARTFDRFVADTLHGDRDGRQP